MKSQEQIFQEDMQRLSNISNKVRSIPFKATVRHADNFNASQPIYSGQEEFLKREAAKEGVKDITQILAENPKLNANINYPEYEERARRIEAQATREREEAARLGQ